MAQDLYTLIGGSGFIGRYVVQELAAQGHRLRIAVRHPDAALFLQPLGAVGQIQLVGANVRTPASIAHAVEGAACVVNLAGILYEQSRQTFDGVQGEGAGVVAAAAAKAGVRRLVHVSALGADAAAPSRYARAKAAGEAAVRAAFPEATIVRPSLVFGPEDQFFNRFAAMARFSPVLPLIGGETRFQPVYVRDVAQAIVAALTLPEAQGTTYELGGPGVYTMRALMEFILEQSWRRRLLVPVPLALAKLMPKALPIWGLRQRRSRPWCRASWCAIAPMAAIAGRPPEPHSGKGEKRQPQGEAIDDEDGHRGVP
jgi:uncharacterized protein YbjT (DUF2867 family)